MVTESQLKRVAKEAAKHLNLIESGRIYFSHLVKLLKEVKSLPNKPLPKKRVNVSGALIADITTRRRIALSKKGKK